MNFRRIPFVLAALPAAFLPCFAFSAAAAPQTVALFPLDCAQPADAWVCLAFNDAVRETFAASGGAEPEPGRRVQKALKKLQLHQGQTPTFNQKDAVRASLGSPLMFEGSLSASQKRLTVRAALFDMEKGEARDVRFEASGFSEDKIHETLDAFRRKLLKSLDLPAAAPGKKDLPQDSAVLLWKARAAYDGGDAPRAAGLLNRVLARDPGLTEAVLLLSRIELESGKFNPAIETLQTLAARHPNNAEVQSLLGTAYYLGRRLLAAENRLRTAARLDPENEEYWILLGQCRRDRYLYSEALEAFEKALEADPANGTALYQSAALAALAGDKKTALLRLKRLLEAEGPGALRPAAGDQDFQALRSDRDFINLIKKASEQPPPTKP